jgi:hypothetical protein
MNPDDDKLKFGSSVKKTQYVPLSPERLNSFVQRRTTPYVPLSVRTGADDSTKHVSDIRVSFANDPEELEKQETIQRIERRLEAWRVKKMEEDPEYKYALTDYDSEDFPRYNKAQKMAFGLSFAVQDWFMTNQIRKEEMSFTQEVERNIRVGGPVRGLIRFGGSILQDIVRGTVGAIGGALPETYANITGKITPGEGISLETDKPWLKFLYGTERERDHFGRVISEKTRVPLESVSARAKRYEDKWRENVPEEERGTLRGEFVPVVGSKFGAVAMYMLEMDFTVLPVKTVSAFMRGSAAARKTANALIDIAERSGAVADEALRREAQTVAKSAVNAKTQLESQRTVNEFIKRVTPEGSVARETVEAIERDIADEIYNARLVLYNQATKAADPDTFVKTVTDALTSERGIRRRVIVDRIAEIQNAPEFVEGTNRYTEIFNQYGADIGTDAGQYAGKLKDDAPAGVVKEFDKLKEELTKVVDLELNPLENQLATLEDEVALGSSVFDFTKNLLDDSGEELEPFLRKLYEDAAARKSAGVRVANGLKQAEKDGEVLDSLELLQRQLTEARLQNVKSTALEKANQYMYGEAVSRGLITKTPLNLFTKGVVQPSVKAPKGAKKAVSSVNERQFFDSGKVGISDTLIEAAKDAVKYDGLQDFIKGSDEVVYQAETPNSFVRDEAVSRKVVGGDINPPVVLAMKQPLNLAKAGSFEWDDVVSLIDPALFKAGVRSFTPEEATAFLEKARLFGYDGLIYARRNAQDISEGTGRIVLGQSQVINAAQFFDNIKGGVDNMGNGISMIARKKEVSEDFAQRMLLKVPGLKTLENKLVSFGLGKKVAREQMVNVYASLLMRYLMKNSKTMLKKNIPSLKDDMHNILDFTTGDRSRLVFTSRKGLQLARLGDEKAVFDILSPDELTDMYGKVAKAFDADAKKRVKDMAKLKIAGGVTEDAFIAKGPGHKAFNESLQELVDTGVFLPEEALLVRTAMVDVADELMERVPMLQRSKGWIKEYGQSRFALGGLLRGNKTWVDGLRLRRGLSYTLMHRLSKDGRKLNAITEQRFATEVFLHEYGHLGYRSLLSKKQQKLVKEIFNNMTEKEKMEMFGNKVVNNVENFRHFMKDENEFFAQAYAQYVIRNRLTHEMLEPMFKRVTNALKMGMKALLGSKPSEKLDALSPLFEQVLRGESRQKGGVLTFRDKNLPKNIKAEWDDMSVVDAFAKKRITRRTPLTVNKRSDFAGKRKLTSRQAIEESRKLLSGGPTGRGIPKQMKKTLVGRPKVSALEEKKRSLPPKEMLDAKVPDDIADMDPLNPKLLKALTPERIFGKGVRVGGTLREGQSKLYRTVSNMQRRWTAERERSTKAIEGLKKSREEFMANVKNKLQTEQDARDSFLQMVKMRKVQMKAVIGVTFSRAQTDELMRLALKVHNPKSFRVAAQRVDEFFDIQLRKAALKKLDNYIDETKVGSDTIPVKWQERIEEVIGPRGIKIKGFKEGYEAKLKKLQEHIEAQEAKYLEELKKNPDAPEPPENMRWDFVSPKTLVMLEHIKDLSKKKSNEFTTLELLKMTDEIEKLFAEGRIAKFVIEGGKTKEVSRLIPKVDPKTGKEILSAGGEPQMVKFVVQKGGEYVPGIKELRTKNQIEYMKGLAKEKKITNIDSADVTTKKFGDLNEDTGVYHQVEEALKDAKSGDGTKWLGLNYLTVDRVFELMDNFKFRGPMYNLIRKPMSEAVARGEDAANQVIDKLSKMEGALEKKYSTKFTDAMYERIAMHAYIKQDGGMRKLVRSGIPKADVEAAKSLSAHEMEMYTFMREELDKMWPAVDRTMRTVHGQRMGRIKDYFPIQNNLLDSRKMHEVLLDEFTVRKRAVQKNFTKERYTVTKGMEMRLNARDIFMKHMRDTNYFVQVEPEIQRVSSLVRDPEFVDIAGRNLTRFMNSWVDIVARRGTPQNYNFNLWDVLHRNLGAATLGFNLSPIIKQPLAVFAAGGLIGLPRIAVNGFGLMNRYKLFDDIANISTEIRLRAADDPAFTEFALTRRLSNIQRNGYYGIKQADAYTTRSVWLAAYTKRLGEKGKVFNPQDFKNKINIDEDALDYADAIVRKTQGSGKFQDLPLMLSSNNKKVWRTIFQFQSFVLGQSQMLTHDALHRTIVAARRGKNGADISLKNAAGDAIKITGSVGAGIYLEDQITQFLTGLYGSESYEQYLEERGVGKQLIDYTSSALPPFGFVAGLMEPDSASLGIPALDKIWMGGRSAVGALTKENPEAKIKDTSRVLEAIVALTAGVPGTGQTGTLLRGQFIGMDRWFKDPYEEYKDAIEKGDKARAAVLRDKYEEQGLDVDEIRKKAKESYKREQNKTERELAEKVAEMMHKADSKEERDKVREYIKKLREKGEITDVFNKEYRSEINSLKRKESLGEI